MALQPSNPQPLKGSSSQPQAFSGHPKPCGQESNVTQLPTSFVPLSNPLPSLYTPPPPQTPESYSDPNCVDYGGLEEEQDWRKQCHEDERIREELAELEKQKRDLEARCDRKRKHSRNDSIARPISRSTGQTAQWMREGMRGVHKECWQPISVLSV